MAGAMQIHRLSSPKTFETQRRIRPEINYLPPHPLPPRFVLPVTAPRNAAAKAPSIRQQGSAPVFAAAMLLAAVLSLLGPIAGWWLPARRPAAAAPATRSA
jgi:hypothetical protein